MLAFKNFDEWLKSEDVGWLKRTFMERMKFSKVSDIILLQYHIHPNINSSFLQEFKHGKQPYTYTIKVSI